MSVEPRDRRPDKLRAFEIDLSGEPCAITYVNSRPFPWRALRTQQCCEAAAPARPDAGEVALVVALRAGDEDAFRSLVIRYHRALVRLARASVSSDAVAEEVAQETWLAVIEGISRFESRSSLRTWIFRILVNQARSRGIRERRIVPMSSLGGAAEDTPAVDPERFVQTGQRWAGHWSDAPVPWTDVPAERLIGRETIGVVACAIDALPAQQRQVVTLRDVDGWTSTEVCEVLGVSEANQRVLLHRGRSRVRAALERP